jgi:hypothetical protein
MKAILVFVGLSLFAAVVAQQEDKSGPNGVIHANSSAKPNSKKKKPCLGLIQYGPGDRNF